MAYNGPQFVNTEQDDNENYNVSQQVYQIRLQLLITHLMGFGYMAFGQGEEVKLPFFRETCRLMIPLATMYSWV